MLSVSRACYGGFPIRLTQTLGVLIVCALVMLAGQALAQSSVRPPDNAVNVQTTAGGSVRPPENAATNAPSLPGETRPVDTVAGGGAAAGQSRLDQQGINSVTSFWGDLRHGGETTVSIPNQQAGTLVQSGGMEWLSWRAKGGPLQRYGGQIIGGVLVLLLLFYLMRGRVQIAGGRSGMLIQRFNGIERFGHWLMAVSFILLALTGLNLLFGKDYLLPLLGKDAFAQITIAGKWVHNNVAWAFMLGLALVFVMWVVHNIPSPTDLKWFAQGGGLFSQDSHPPSRKFNGGQKVVFWATILLGASISLSGISLLFPYEAPLFAKTFEILNTLGAASVWGEPLPTALSPMQEMQYAQIWHTLVSLVLIGVILAHIYIGTLGMEGAFAAMGSGMVDRQWAKEHHGLWVAEEDAKVSSQGGSAGATAAE